MRHSTRRWDYLFGSPCIYVSVSLGRGTNSAFSLLLVPAIFVAFKTLERAYVRDETHKPLKRALRIQGEDRVPCSRKVCGTRSSSGEPWSISSPRRLALRVESRRRRHNRRGCSPFSKTAFDGWLWHFLHSLWNNESGFGRASGAFALCTNCLGIESKTPLGTPESSRTGGSTSATENHYAWRYSSSKNRTSLN